jgi:hypothetical protein
MEPNESHHADSDRLMHLNVSFCSVHHQHEDSVDGPQKSNINQTIFHDPTMIYREIVTQNLNEILTKRPKHGIHEGQCQPKLRSGNWMHCQILAKSQRRPIGITVADDEIADPIAPERPEAAKEHRKNVWERPSGKKCWTDNGGLSHRQRERSGNEAGELDECNRDQRRQILEGSPNRVFAPSDHNEDDTADHKKAANGHKQQQHPKAARPPRQTQTHN